MQIKIFSISYLDDGSMQDEINVFLRTHKIIRSIEKEHIDKESNFFWLFKVWYIEGDKSSSVEETRNRMKNQYKEEVEELKRTLTEEQKKMFESLRTVRQKIAEEDSISNNSNIFSDKELLLIVRMEEHTLFRIMEMEEIKKDRKEKYAERLIKGYRLMAPTA